MRPRCSSLRFMGSPKPVVDAGKPFMDGRMRPRGSSLGFSGSGPWRGGVALFRSLPGKHRRGRDLPSIDGSRSVYDDSMLHHIRSITESRMAGLTTARLLAYKEALMRIHESVESLLRRRPRSSRPRGRLRQVGSTVAVSPRYGEGRIGMSRARLSHARPESATPTGATVMGR
jgi:hypothetical protein